MSIEQERKFLEPEIKRVLQKQKEFINAGFPSVSWKAVVKNICETYDRIIQLCFSSFGAGFTDQLCLIALGSYGRKEACPHSDLDLLILHNGLSRHRLENFSSQLLSLLWDQKIKVGHSIHTPEQYLKLAEVNHTVLTALLDARYLAGNKKLFRSLMQDFNQLLEKQARTYLSAKLNELEERRKKYAQVVWVNEFHLLEGTGGLRDWHLARWLAKALERKSPAQILSSENLLSRQEKRKIPRALQSLFKTRIALHLLTKEKTDQLRLEYQNDLVRFLQIKPNRNYLDPKDALFSWLYSGAELIQQILERLVYWLEKKYLSRPSQAIPQFAGVKKTDSQIEIFPQSQKEFSLKNLSSLLIHCSRFQLMLSPQAQAYFSRLERKKKQKLARELEKIFYPHSYAGKLLAELKPTGLLKEFFPRLEQAFYFGQRDGYHRFTVGWHSLRCLEILEKFQQEPEFALEPDINWKILKLAGLCHDLGKASNQDHSKKGAKLARKLAKKIKLSPDEANLLTFLVREHLLLNHFAQRRDFYEPEAIEYLVKKIKTPARLKMLYLLTIADIKAVSETSWTSWKQELLHKLYHLLLSAMEKKESIPQQVEKQLEKILRELKKQSISPSKIEELKRLPTRYLLGTPEEKIIHHLKLLGERNPGEVKIIPNLLESRQVEVEIICDDRPGLFAQICGAITAFNYNILSAEINTFEDNTALDIFILDDLIAQTGPDWSQEAKARLEKLSENLTSLLKGEITAQELLKKKRGIFRPRPRQKIIPKVGVDEHYSDHYVILEVQSPDRLGLLYEINQIIFQQGLDIHFAKISTRAEKVFDIFYLRDPKTKAKPSPEKIAQLVRALRSQLENLAQQN